MRDNHLIDPIESALDAYGHEVARALVRHAGFSPARSYDVMGEARRCVISHVEAEEDRRARLAAVEAAHRLKEERRYA